MPWRRRYPSITELPEIDVSKPGRHSYFVQHADENKFGQFEVEVSSVRCLPGRYNCAASC